MLCLPSASGQKYLVTIANHRNRLRAIYRARARLATLTPVARGMPIFHELDLEERLSFFDLLFMLGFGKFIVSDGEIFSNRYCSNNSEFGNFIASLRKEKFI